MKAETLKYGLLLVDMLLLSINIALEVAKRRNSR